MVGFIDRSGQKYWRWTVLYRAPNNARGHTFWRCKCECGNEKDIFAGHLVNGSNKSCGCLKKEVNRSRSDDITGMTFGRLKVTGLSKNVTSRNTALWDCVCTCGNKVTKSASALRTANTRSCGCLAKEYKEKDIVNITGLRFGIMTVVGRDETRSGKTYLYCVCDCGNAISISSSYLKRKITRCCGCLSGRQLRQLPYDHAEYLYNLKLLHEQEAGSPNSAAVDAVASTRPHPVGKTDRSRGTRRAARG